MRSIKRHWSYQCMPNIERRARMRKVSSSLKSLRYRFWVQVSHPYKSRDQDYCSMEFELCGEADTHPGAQPPQCLDCFLDPGLNSFVQSRSIIWDDACVNVCKVMMYADDMVIFFSAPQMREIEIQLNLKLIDLSEWLPPNKLILHLKKTQFRYNVGRRIRGTFRCL